MSFLKSDFFPYIGDWVSNRPRAQTFFRPLYHCQLWLSLFFLKWAGAHSVYLRRPGVLSDAIPGKSDYDLTCVVDTDQCYRVAVLVGRLRRFSPALGEVWVVASEDLATHLRWACPDYGPVPYLLSGKSTEGKSVYRYSEKNLQRKLLTFLRLQLQPLLARGIGAGAYEAAKVSYKLDWFCEWFFYGRALAIEYQNLSQHHPKPERSMLLSLDSMVRQAEFTESSPALTFSVSGRLHPFSAAECAAFQLVYEREFSPYASHISEAFVFRHRPHRFINSYLLVVKNRGELLSNSEFRLAWKRASETLVEKKIGVTPGCVLVLEESEWEFYRKVDPIAELYCNSLRWDLLQGILIEQTVSQFRISQRLMESEGVDAVVQSLSALGRKDTNYLVDLIGGQILLYAKALQTGVWDLNCPTALTEKTESEWDLLSAQLIWRSWDPILETALAYLRAKLKSSQLTQ